MSNFTSADIEHDRLCAIQDAVNEDAAQYQRERLEPRGGYKFILVLEQGQTTVIVPYGDDPVSHFDTSDAAFDYANRRAAEDGASVLLRADNRRGGFWLDMTNRERGF